MHCFGHLSHLFALLSSATGATNSRSDRITQALSASADSIGLAVTSNSNVQAAAQKSKAFATLATRENTKASDFGRRLFSGKLLACSAAGLVLLRLLTHRCADKNCLQASN
jgi:hypothetical protein